MVRCSIVVPVFNRSAVTRQCLDRLLSGKEATSFDVTVVDDASTDDTPAALTAYERRVRVVRHTRNEGFARSCNDGAAASAGDYVVFLNNDTIPRRGWLDALVGYADRTRRAAAVGSSCSSRTGSSSTPGLVIGRHCTPGTCTRGSRADHPAVCKLAPLPGRHCGVRPRPARRVRAGGRVRHRASSTAYEDVDLCLRLGERGLESTTATRACSYHLESVSRTPERYEELNRLFLERWAGRVRPDDLDVYVEDGLLGLDGGDGYPLRLLLSPRLGVLAGPGGGRAATACSGCGRTRRSRCSSERSRSYVELLEQAGGAAPARRDGPLPRGAGGRVGAAVAAPRRRSDGVWHESERSGRCPTCRC